jgi:hypothetical protein
MGAFIPPPEELFNASLESHLSGAGGTGLGEEIEKTSTRKNTDLTEKSQQSEAQNAQDSNQIV